MGRRVEFRSRGETCVGVLDLPDGARGPVPLVVMAGGWCYTKEIVMPYYADYLRRAGVATLVFDYRRFGESTGEPRQHIDPWEQIEDYRNALSYAEGLSDIDHERTGVWGISYSGGHVLVLAAIDQRVAFAISTIPVVDGFTTIRRCHGERRFADLMKHLAEDRKMRFETGKPSAYMPMSSQYPHEEISSWPYPHVNRIFNEIKQNEAPRHEHYNTVESVELLLQYEVEPFCRRIIDVPVLMTVAKGDNITSADLETEAFNAVLNPNKTLATIEGVDHMSLYSNREHLAKVGSVQGGWLEDVLARKG